VFLIYPTEGGVRQNVRANATQHSWTDNLLKQ
jgi:hypothetical protein